MKGGMPPLGVVVVFCIPIACFYRVLRLRPEWFVEGEKNCTRQNAYGRDPSEVLLKKRYSERERFPSNVEGDVWTETLLS